MYIPLKLLSFVVFSSDKKEALLLRPQRQAAKGFSLEPPTQTTTSLVFFNSFLFYQLNPTPTTTTSIQSTFPTTTTRDAMVRRYRHPLRYLLNNFPERRNQKTHISNDEHSRKETTRARTPCGSFASRSSCLTSPSESLEIGSPVPPRCWNS